MMVNFVVRLPEDLRKRARAVATLQGETLSQDDDYLQWQMVCRCHRGH